MNSVKDLEEKVAEIDREDSLIGRAQRLCWRTKPWGHVTVSTWSSSYNMPCIICGHPEPYEVGHRFTLGEVHGERAVALAKIALSRKRESLAQKLERSSYEELAPYLDLVTAP